MAVPLFHVIVAAEMGFLRPLETLTGQDKKYLLTPWCRVLPEQLTGLHLVKKLPAFHGTRRFITALTSVRHLSLFWASPIQSTCPHPTSWRSILILSTHLRLGLPSGLFPSGFPTKTSPTKPSATHNSMDGLRATIFFRNEVSGELKMSVKIIHENCCNCTCDDGTFVVFTLH